jgi:hypothetical protein
MSARSHGVLTGSAVLLFGILALSSLAGGRLAGDGDGAGGSTPTTAPPVVPSVTTEQTSRPGIPGVPLPVERVLFLRGKADAVPLERLTDIPAVVAAVLAEYGATLTVPEASVQRSVSR